MTTINSSNINTIDTNNIITQDQTVKSTTDHNNTFDYFGKHILLDNADINFNERLTMASRTGIEIIMKIIKNREEELPKEEERILQEKYKKLYNKIAKINISK
jgi:hypothetical protein